MPGHAVQGMRHENTNFAAEEDGVGGDGVVPAAVDDLPLLHPLDHGQLQGHGLHLQQVPVQEEEGASQMLLIHHHSQPY